MLELDKIYNMDCIEGMKQIDDSSIDMILCDLPYGVTQNKWDSLIPLDKLWKEYHRVRRESTAIVLTSQNKFTYFIINSNLDEYRYSLIWEKDRPVGFLNASRMPLCSHEDICIFYRKLPTYNPQMQKGNPLHGMGRKYKRGNLANSNYGIFDSSVNPSADRQGDTNKYPKSVLHFSKYHPQIHPTQKPLKLFEYLIKTYSNENDLVLDNCIGSGTTAVACKRLNRRFIGFEINKEYYDISLKRLLNVPRRLEEFIT